MVRFDIVRLGVELHGKLSLPCLSRLHNCGSVRIWRVPQLSKVLLRQLADFAVLNIANDGKCNVLRPIVLFKEGLDIPSRQPSNILLKSDDRSAIRMLLESLEKQILQELSDRVVVNSELPLFQDDRPLLLKLSEYGLSKPFRLQCEPQFQLVARKVVIVLRRVYGRCCIQTYTTFFLYNFRKIICNHKFFRLRFDITDFVLDVCDCLPVAFGLHELCPTLG
mmetsp:Transcript_10162/g.31090  ORF Transcript_10162/g.31090 Transcript_10162/m.31090 type:complete len:222 (+) Transcript_10162:631-1296(+)